MILTATITCSRLPGPNRFPADQQDASSPRDQSPVEATSKDDSWTGIGAGSACLQVREEWNETCGLPMDE